MESSTEAYLLLLLSDGNLPTGSFVASSGLESLVKHGHFSRSWMDHEAADRLSKSPIPQSTEATINFIRDSLQSNAHSTLPFISHTHGIVTGYLSGDGTLESALDDIKRSDALYESMTLNHVTRRASKAQGVALLTLFSKGFAQPSWMAASHPNKTHERKPEEVVDAFKAMVRRDIHGNLPICWAVLTASLGLSIGRSQHLHLFLHVRALLSASIRLNTLGPYAAQQLLLHVVRPLVDAALDECKDLRIPLRPEEPTNEDDDGPATTWPLGEILAARHDLQHSRIFNS